MVSAEDRDSNLAFQNNAVLDFQIQEIMSRPEFEDARFGMEFSLLATDELIYSLNREELYNPASTMKIFTAGLVYSTLGPDFRFHTPIYRTGPIVDGVLKGDLVLQASGDLLLGGRVNPDGTINLPETDHTYGMSKTAVPVSDNPLDSLYEFAERIAASGITNIEGTIIVDDSLFVEGRDSLGGSGEYIISPIMINDNLVDVWVIPGENVDEPAILKIMPDTPYLTILNKVMTTAPGENQGEQGRGIVTPFGQKPRFENDIINPDGTHTAILSGTVVLGDKPVLCTYIIPEPARFAEIALKMVLEEKGISSNVDLLQYPDLNALSVNYTDENKVAEIVSPSLRDELLPMMKVSSNLHTAAWPYLVGAITGHEPENARKKGLKMQAEMYREAGVDLNVPLEDFQELSEIAGTRYSPKSYTNYLKYLHDQSYFDEYLTILPILGVDGISNDIDANLAAAGHVFAKTGTAMSMTRTSDGQAQGFLVKALAGFMELPNGQIVSFSVFIDYSTMNPNPASAQKAIGDIVNAVYEHMTHYV